MFVLAILALPSILYRENSRGGYMWFKKTPEELQKVELELEKCTKDFRQHHRHFETEEKLLLNLVLQVRKYFIA